MIKENLYSGRDILDGVSLNFFSAEDVRAIHYATLEIFQNPGVQVSNAEARQIFKEAGCEVDEKTWVVKIPEHVLKRALATAPSKIKLYGRDKEHTFTQEVGGKVHFTCFGTGVKMCKYDSPGVYKTVDSTEEDVANTARICDWAENIDSYSLAVSARDWAGKGAQDVHETFTPLMNTSKHFFHIDPVGEHVEYYWDLITAYYGGDEEQARKRPIFSELLCPTSPLELGDNACQLILKSVRFGIPINVISMAMSGASCPIFLAGTLVTHNVEVLSGIILAQLASPGAKVWYGSSTTTFDLKHGTAPVGSPELGLISAAVAKLGQYYGLPTYVAST